MILTCPECDTRFLVPTELLLPEGRKVRCSSCKHTWHQNPDTDDLDEFAEKLLEEIEDPIPDAITPKKGKAASPVIPKEQNKKAMAGSAAISLVFFCVILSVLLFMGKNTMLTHPNSIAFYKIFGVEYKTPGEGLVFDHLVAKRDAHGEVTVQGKIINLSASEKPLPRLKARLKDNDGNIVEEWIIEMAENKLHAESDISFSSRYTARNKTATQITVGFTLGVSAGKSSKISSEGDDNTHAPPPAAHTPPSDHGASSESPAHGGGQSHQAPSH